MATPVRTEEPAANFDRLAGVYRWMEWLSFGPWLSMCRRTFLPELAGAGSTVVFGDGDGRFTAALLRRAPDVRVEAVDASGAMLEQLLRRAGKDAGRVRMWHGDARAWRGSDRVDLVVTHFFLDCLTTDEVGELAQRVADVASPGARWVVSEFAVSRGWFGRCVARPLIGFLYRVFGWLTGLRVRELPDYGGELRAAGFRREQQRRYLGGLLVAEIWAYRGITGVHAGLPANPGTCSAR